MRNTLRLIALSLLATWAALHGAAAQDFSAEQATAKALIETAMSTDLGYEIIESLTTEVGPRLVGTLGDRRAVSWAEAKLKALGFDKVWTEPVALQGWVRGAEQARIVAPYDQPLQITTLGGSVATKAGGIAAEVIQFESVDDLMVADAKDVAWKIVFLSQRMTRTQDGSGYGVANRNRRLGAIEAGRKGALAVLIRSIGTDSHRLPHTGQMAAYEPTIPPIPAAALSNPDADLLERVLSRGMPTAVSLNLQPRNLGGVTTYNVIGDMTGTQNPEQIVLIGAHLDSWDLGTGAVDDGAGIGIVTAAAKLIGNMKERPKRTVRVVMFGAEEVGLIGARAYMKAHEDTLDNHIVAAESDFGARKIWAIASRVHDDKAPVFADLMRVLRPLGVNYRGNAAYGGPDVGMLAKKNVPLASLMQDGSDYFDLHHTADDTFDKIDPADIRQNVAAYAAFAYLMADVDVNWRAANTAALNN
ncbi:MAG: M20/M25/M40 family metallo-hydrolase [Pseudomonadota bacterium]